MSVMDPQPIAVDAAWLMEQIPGRGAQEIGVGVETLIVSGQLAAGAQLPTIRELAKAAGVSVGTVLTAWNHLRDLDLIETRRRGGTVVRPPAVPSREPRADADWSTIDLQQGAPDLLLQPNLTAALLDSLTAPNLNVFGREYMTDRLHAAVVPEWPFPAEAWTTAGGGTEALLLATAAAAAPGSSVAIDEPASPGFLDTLRDLGLTPLPVAVDEDGPDPASLQEALDAGASAFVYQPGAPFASRHVVTRERARDLADVLARPRNAHVIVVEDDSIGPLSPVEPPTVGTALPERVLRVRSYCKAYGIDVRTSVIGGPRSLVDRTIALRSHGVGSNSRILQNTLAYLVTSDAVAAEVDAARERYHARRRMLRTALEKRGLTVHGVEGGIVLWVEVTSETDALVMLAAQGILAGAGSKSFVSPLDREMIRLSPLQLPEDRPELFERLADAVADAARGGRREFFD